MTPITLEFTLDHLPLVYILKLGVYDVSLSNSFYVTCPEKPTGMESL